LEQDFPPIVSVTTRVEFPTGRLNVLVADAELVRVDVEVEESVPVHVHVRVPVTGFVRAATMFWLPLGRVVRVVGVLGE
jgi:hypothetical protein